MHNTDRHPIRNSNIELLRVLSMLMIVAYHYAIFGFYAEDLMFSPNKYFVDVFGMGGKLGTDIFVLISGYYMINSRLTIKKLLSIAGQVWFYTVSIFLVFALVSGFDSVLGALRISFFPLLFSHYWFASYYVLLLLLSPFLNTLIHKLDKKQHGLLCAILFLLCCFIPEFIHIQFAAGSLPLFVCLYVWAAYCRLHVGHSSKVAKRSLALALLFTLLCVARIIVCDFIFQRMGDSSRLAGSTNFMGSNSPFAFIIAVLLLLAACCRAPGKNAFISTLGSLTFGVYLLHANQLVGNVLWQDIFHTSSYAGSPWLFAHAFITVAVIYAVCCFIDWLRLRLIAPLWDSLCSKAAPVLGLCFEKAVDACCRLLHLIIADKPN